MPAAFSLEEREELHGFLFRRETNEQIAAAARTREEKRPLRYSFPSTRKVYDDASPLSTPGVIFPPFFGPRTRADTPTPTTDEHLILYFSIDSSTVRTRVGGR